MRIRFSETLLDESKYKRSINGRTFDVNRLHETSIGSRNDNLKTMKFVDKNIKNTLIK